MLYAYMRMHMRVHVHVLCTTYVFLILHNIYNSHHTMSHTGHHFFSSFLIIIIINKKMSYSCSMLYGS